MSSRDIVFSAAGAGGDVNYIDDVFSTYLYTGNSSTQTINNGIDLAGKGGLVWVKQRGPAGNNHQLADTVRGASSQLASNTTAAATSETNRFTSFNSNGFSLDSSSFVNNSTQTYCSWTFREQAKFFDIVTYTGNGAADRDIAHNLGSVPGMIVIKCTSGTGNWATAASLTSTTYGIGGGGTGSGYEFSLNLGDDYYDNPLKSTIASSTTVNVPRVYYNNAAICNQSGATYVMYLFASDAGGFGTAGTDNVISCGRFTSSGSVTSVTLGYEPQFVLIKRVGASGGWLMFDTMRGYTVQGQPDNYLLANSSDAEVGGSNYGGPTATGFDWYPSGEQTYIYMAIRRPMKPPTVATTVFNPVYGQSGAPGFRSSNFNAGIDTSFVFLTSGYNDGTNAYQNLQARLTGLRQLQTGNTRAEVSQSYNTWDYMNGQNNTTFYSPPWGSWLFKRASGFHDVVCYTGTGSATTQAHNLGVAPELMIVKIRNDAEFWRVYSSALGNTKGLYLNTTSEEYTTAIWNNTSPTSTNFSLGTSASVNGAGYTYVAYLFASVAGVSKVGSYTGNGTLTTINCGFTGGARFVLIKRTDSSGDWYVWDTTRGMVAGTNPSLTLNTYAAEVNANSVYTTTTGFQLLASPAVDINTSGASYIFLAVA